MEFMNNIDKDICRYIQIFSDIKAIINTDGFPIIKGECILNIRRQN